MAKYITQELFNMCSVMALKISCAKGSSIREASNLVASHYSSDYSDTHLTASIESAALSIKEFMEESLPEGDMIENCTQLQFCIKEYNPDGTKKKKKFFGGTFFNNESKEISDKPKMCMRDILAYHLNIMNGAIPIAPANWRM